MSRATRPKSRTPNSSVTESETSELKGQQSLSPTDASTAREFGGPLGMLAMMLGFPLLMYFMWAGAVFYDGQIPRPAQNESFAAFAQHLWFLIRTEAYPTKKAWCIYWSFGFTQLAFYALLPGVYRKGQPLPHLGGKQLDYYCSAMWSFYTSVALGVVLHFSGYFRMDVLIGEYGPLMSVAIISGFLCSFVAYFSAIARGATLRMSGNHIVDFFMGAELNPRMFGILDFKMLVEVRIAWFILFFLALSTCLKQFEEYGYVSVQACFLLIAQYLYAGACAKGEHLIITTWDIYYEKTGFMILFWTMAGVPFSYAHAILYIANHEPSQYQWPWWFVLALLIPYLGVYYVWDTCNSQKNQFRQEERGVVDERTTFPYFKQGKIQNPRTIETSYGKKLLCDGWYGKARKIHYSCDIYFAINWGLITGFASPFPWFYPVFFTIMIMHRALRDNAKCHDRYGKAWETYTKKVPYIFIPGVI
ncbi:Delta(24(24(1)))-sterol reductase [Alternaria tenuissima]|uniref:Delta(24(24(1)))-sterol reductase n=1 Tax=Alternaria tenuissima TaxID=119927 RepID=A0AB37VZD6_9PLEO|nr:Delta(24(24(1)))-sterol reductase [Alternaria tenuissima]